MKCVISFSVQDGLAISNKDVVEKFFQIKFVKEYNSKIIDKFIEEISNDSEYILNFDFVTLFKSPREDSSSYEILVRGKIELKNEEVEFIVGFNPENASEFSII